MSARVLKFEDLSANYPFVVCDVWGVLHNGQQIYNEAAFALAEYRKQGGKVVLLTNSPRRNGAVGQQIDEMGGAEGAYDEIVTSGDVTRSLIEKANKAVFHLGPQRDLPLYDGIDVTLCDDQSCQTIVCTGLMHDDDETPDQYRDQLQALADRDVPFICANPDLVVERGEDMIFCAGSLAQLYTQLGGRVQVAGKPHKPIYDLAMERLNQLTASTVSKSAVLAIGDGMPTDVKGAHDNGFDLLYISGGIHSRDYGPVDEPDEKALDAFLKNHQVNPRGWMPRLIW